MSIKPRGKRKVLSIFLMIVMMLSMCCVGCNGENGSGNTIEQEMLSDETVESIVFPHVVDDGKLEITSLFQYTGINPDCGNEEGENIAALTVTNTTDEYLEHAIVEIELQSGEKLEFEVSDLPPGRGINVFEKNNVSYESSDECTSIKIDAKHSNEDVLWSDKIEIQVDGTNVIITNVSEDMLSDMVIHCHCMLDDTYFGGLTYKYPVEKIETGESILVEAIDCYLGQADIVRISQDNSK